MGKITFIIGGARSGKSSYALALAKKKKKVAFIATCEPLDAEMKRRISLHRRNRPGHWLTVEEPRDLNKAFQEIGGRFDCVVIDCLTLLISNLILKGIGQKAIEEKVTRALRQLKKIKGSAVLVSNEVGFGIVPQNKLSRGFRDVAGTINQLVAKEADEVILMVAGLPLRIK